MRNLKWQEDAACKEKDVNIFFLPDNSRMGEKRRLIAEAKAVCATCPVRAECLQYSLDLNEYFGVWGGLSADERQIIIRRKKVSNGTAA